MKKVYLNGLINPNAPLSLGWRADVQRVMGAMAEFIDPTYKENVDSDERSAETDGQMLLRATPREILMRDYIDIRRSDIILSCLDSFNSPRPPTGTLFELAWAWEMRKPIIAFDFGNPFYPNHPFIAESVTVWVKGGLNEAAIQLKEYWL